MLRKEKVIALIEDEPNFPGEMPQKTFEALMKVNGIGRGLRWVLRHNYPFRSFIEAVIRISCRVTLEVLITHVKEMPEEP
jgi:hypothetical protein